MYKAGSVRMRRPEEDRAGAGGAAHPGRGRGYQVRHEVKFDMYSKDEGKESYRVCSSCIY